MGVGMYINCGKVKGIQRLKTPDSAYITHRVSPLSVFDADMPYALSG